VTLSPNEPQDLGAVDVPSDLPLISLRAVNAVTRHLPAIETARVQVTEEMETMVQTGLVHLVGVALASPSIINNTPRTHLFWPPHYKPHTT
jgi:hypothetical protein